MLEVTHTRGPAVAAAIRPPFAHLLALVAVAGRLRAHLPVVRDDVETVVESPSPFGARVLLGAHAWIAVARCADQLSAAGTLDEFPANLHTQALY
jgi:hypothetical protein